MEAIAIANDSRFGLGASLGHKEQLREFVAALRGDENRLISWDEAATASTTVFAAQESIRLGEPVDLAGFRARLLTDPPGPQAAT